ncbi:hypothetical protein L0156_13745 [bacterium]|nr:hypothetical protein [bacterium]
MNQAILISMFMVFFTREDMSPVEYYRLFLEAQKHQEQSDFEMVAKICEKLVKHYGDDSEVWELLADARRELGEYEAAAEAYKKAQAFGAWNPSFQSYWIARMFALAGKQREALQWLERAVAEGYEWRPEIAEDAAFSNLKEDPRFLKLAGSGPNITNRNEGWLADLDYLVSEMTRLSILYRNRPIPKELQEGIQTLRRKIPELTDEQILFGFQRLVVLLGDGHSYLIPWTAQKGSFTYIGFRFWFFSDGLCIIDAPEKWKQLIGNKILRIGNTPSEDLLGKIEPLISRDNSMMFAWVAPVFLNIPQMLHYLGILSDPNKVPLLLQDRKGKIQEITVQSEGKPNIKNIPKLISSQLPGAPSAPVYLSRLEDHYWFERWPDFDAVYFQFNRVLNKPDESLSDFSGRLRRFLSETKVRNLVVDVRNNHGGDGSLFQSVLKTLIHFETTRENPQLFILTSRSTFSATQIFIKLSTTIPTQFL